MRFRYYCYFYQSLLVNFNRISRLIGKQDRLGAAFVQRDGDGEVSVYCVLRQHVFAAAGEGEVAAVEGEDVLSSGDQTAHW